MKNGVQADLTRKGVGGCPVSCGPDQRQEHRRYPYACQVGCSRNLDTINQCRSQYRAFPVLARAGATRAEPITNGTGNAHSRAMGPRAGSCRVAPTSTWRHPPVMIATAGTLYTARCLDHQPHIALTRKPELAVIVEMLGPAIRFPRIRSIVCGLIFGLFLLPAAVSADTTLEYAEAGKQNLVRIAQGKIRLDTHRGSDWFLFDTARHKLAIVNPQRREYMMIDEAKADSLRRGMDGVTAQMDEQIAKLPPSMQAQARQMMGQVLPDRTAKKSVRVEATGQSGRAAGYPCEFKRFVVNGKVESEVCLTAAGNLGLPAGDLAAVRDWQGFARSIADKATGYLDIDPRVFGDGDQIPLIYSYSGSSGQGVLTRITHVRLDPGLLAVPTGFRQRQVEIPFQ